MRPTSGEVSTHQGATAACRECTLARGAAIGGSGDRRRRRGDSEPRGGRTGGQRSRGATAAAPRESREQGESNGRQRRRELNWRNSFRTTEQGRTIRAHNFNMIERRCERLHADLELKCFQAMETERRRVEVCEERLVE